MRVANWALSFWAAWPLESAKEEPDPLVDPEELEDAAAEVAVAVAAAAVVSAAEHEPPPPAAAVLEAAGLATADDDEAPDAAVPDAVELLAPPDPEPDPIEAMLLRRKLVYSLST